MDWFKRMGDIPGLEYEPPVAIDRTKLAWHDAVPELMRFDFDGKVNESLWWEYVEDGEKVSTSASPAHARASASDDRTRTASVVLGQLWEVLELPGEAADYHFAIQGAVGELWRQRRSEPDSLEWYEYLCLLDLRLVQAAPDTVRDQYADARPERGPEYYVVSAFANLIGLYTREGFLDEALEIARVADRFGQGSQAIADLQNRMAALQAEDGS